MSETDSPLSEAPVIPADADIEQCIRNVVRAALSKNEDITVNGARTRAESELGLEAGFFKNDTRWKDLSKNLIHAAFEGPTSPESKTSSATLAKVKSTAKVGSKRKSDEPQPQKKRQKNGRVVESRDNEKHSATGGSSEDEEEAVSKPRSQSRATKKSSFPDAPEDDEEDGSGDGRPVAVHQAIDDDSDMSSLIDDPPPRKKGSKKKSTSPRPKSKPSRPSTTTSSKDSSADDEEIKRLQSYLLKCGIRKLWHRELAPFSTPREKIRHLRQMLEDVGMTGRFSAEKAKQIKEARELKAELEAAKKFNEQWGHGSGGEESDEGDWGGRTRKLKPKGLVDFGDSEEDGSD